MRRSSLFHSSLLFAVGFASLLGPCEATTTEPDSSPPRTLEEATERWRNRGFTAYRYRFARQCFCAPSHLSTVVSVRGDTVFAIEDVSANGTPIEETDHRLNPETVKTVDQLFDLIRSANQGTIDSVSVAYDEQLGFPSELFVDPLQNMADEEITYTIGEVAAIAPEED